MKKLVQFLLENNMEDMKDFIVKTIDNVDDEKTIKRIYDILSKSGFDTKVIDKFFSDRAIDDAKKMILSVFESNSTLSEFFKLCNGEIDLPDASRLVAGSNIYDVFGGLGFDKQTLIDLATTNPPRNSVTRGWYEILSQIFLKNISPENKGRGDVNAGADYQMEYKAPNARVKGQNIETTEKIDRKFEELIGGRIDIKKYGSGYLTLISNINKIFNTDLKDFSQDEIVDIIAQSIIAQFDEGNKEWIEFVKNHKRELFKGSKIDSDFFKILYGVMDMYYYQHEEKFTHMILFKGKTKNDKGDYVVLTSEMFNSFESIYNAINNLNIKFTAMPRVSKNAREWAVQIAAI